jgi:membrane associated rhomboid family serine protease
LYCLSALVDAAKQMETLLLHIPQIVFIAGLGQIALVFGSMAVPKVLGWEAALSSVHPLIRQMFWTYSAYIFTINLCFGLISALDYGDITNGTHLAGLLTGFIAVYWISRVLIQFFYFDRANFPIGKWHKLAEVALVSLFVFLSIVYSTACYYNFSHLPA